MAEQTKLVWTAIIPTKKGYYWIELKSEREFIAELSNYDDSDIHFLDGDIPYWPSEINRYAGPIPKPVDE